MRIGFFELEGWEEKFIREAFHGHELYLSREKIDKNNLPERKDLEIISVFIDSRIMNEVLSSLPDLKFIATRSTGYDHLDLAALKKRNIAAAYVPGYGDNTVAEFAFGLLLNLTRKIYQCIDRVKESGSFSSAGLRGVDLKGKMIGVVGTGRIGREVVKIAKGFGMDVLASDPYPNEKFAKELGFEYVPLEELLGKSDFLTFHCPLSKETRHLINMDNINLVRRGAYLVNTARGGVVDTTALIYALKEGILAGAALDVLEEEAETKDELEFLSGEYADQEELRTLVENHVLIKMPNVLVTPHNAFNSEEAMRTILDTTIRNISGFIEGKPENLIS